jgi:uncharacterized membrane protein YkvI
MWQAGFKWMFLIMGTMIGAGYASGRELWQFFGHESGLAIFLFTILFITCCYVIMKMSFEKKTVHYIPILQSLIGTKMTRLYDMMIILYLFSTTVIMLAGGGAALEVFYLPYWAGILVISLLLVLLFVWDIKGMLSMNSAIIPMLITGLIVVLLSFSLSSEVPWEFKWREQGNWPSALTFTALNILPLIAVLSAVGNEIKHQGEIWIASVGSGLILGGISFIYNQSLLQITNEIMLYEIPLFAILKHYPYSMLVFMSILLWFAIYTTAASGVFGIISRFRKKFNLPSWILAFLTVIVMIPLTRFGFANLVAVLYPLYGLLNLYVLVSILLYPIVNRFHT